MLVPVDFERDDVGEKLVAAGFQQNSPALFTWLGVVPYLTQDAIGRTLDYMSSIQNSEVVFDYMEPPEASSEEVRRLETERTEQLKKIDERSVSRFEPAGIAAILRSHGFCAIEDINFQEIASRFGRCSRRISGGDRLDGLCIPENAFAEQCAGPKYLAGTAVERLALASH
jgi:methyltransferase (TIGR00027 family)